MLRGLTVACCIVCLAAASVAQEAKSQKKPIELGEISVTAAREGSATNGYRSSSGQVGPLGNIALKETPYSINVTPGELIANRVSHDPVDALKTVPTVAPLMSAGGYSSMHRIMVRGFTAADQSELRDGLCDRSFTVQPMENVERIEVLNGVSSFLYGFSALGGTVNYISKKPTDKPMTEFTAGTYNKGIAFGHLDVGGPLNSGLGYRFNAYREAGETYIDGGDQSRSLASGALTCRLSDNTCLSASFYQQTLNAHGIATYFDISGIGNQVPAAMDPTKQYGQDWTYNRSEKSVYSIGLDSRLNGTFSIRTAYLRGDMWRQYRFVNAKFTDTDGNYTENFIDSPRNEEVTDAAYALLDASFDALKIEHNLTFGYTHWGFTFWRGADLTKALGSSSIGAPVSYSVPAHAGEIDRDTPTTTHNVLLGDRMVFNSEWSLLAGLNYARTETEYHDAYLTSSPPQPTGYSGPMSSREKTSGDYLSPTLGLVYNVHPSVSTYASYMQGIAQGGTAPTTASNAGEILDTSASDQFELGAKATVAKTLDLTLALFRMDKVNEYVDPADKVYKQDGREIHQGVELLASGRAFNSLTIVGGVTVMSAEIDKAANNTKTEGETPVNVPETGARLYLEYQVPEVAAIPGVLTLCAGANYYGKRPVDIPNVHYIDDVTLFDAGVRYQPTGKLTFNLNVSNLADERYWQYYRSGDGLLIGDPLLVAFSAKCAF